MNELTRRGDSLELRLSFFMILGAVLGAVFCNMMEPEMKKELLGIEKSFLSSAALHKLDFAELFFQVAAGRLSTLFLGLLCAMTAAAPWFFAAGLGWLGFSSAVMICALTMDGGLLGIYRYFLLVTPQWICYLPVWYLLAWWLPVNRKSLRPAAAALLFFMVILGAAAESFLNPWLAALVL